MSELSSREDSPQDESKDEQLEEEYERQESLAKGPRPEDGEDPLPWVEKKEAILANLDMRVESALELKRVLDGVSLENSEEQVSANLMECLEKKKACFSSETIKGMERFKEIEKETQKLEKKIDKIRKPYKDEGGGYRLPKNGRS